MYNPTVTSMQQNPFLRARQRNILAPQLGPQQPQPHQTFSRPEEPMDPMERPRGTDIDRYFEEMQRIQGNGSPSLNAYKSMLSNQPTREQYAPGIMKRIGTALAGGAIAYGGGDGYGMAKEVQETPYRNAMEQYGQKLKGLGEQANIEQDNTDSQLRMLQNARAMGLKYDEFDLKRRESDSKMQNDTTTAQAAKARAEAYAASIGKKNYTPTPVEGGVLFTNNNDPRDTFTVPAKTIAAGQLGVNRRNASTGEKNAETSVRRTNIYGTSVNDNAIQDSFIRRRGDTSPPSPNAQEDAENMALDELARDPDFQGFVKKSGGFAGFGGYNDIGDDDGSEEYKIFIEALNAKTQEILRGNRRRTAIGGSR